MGSLGKEQTVPVIPKFRSQWIIRAVAVFLVALLSARAASAYSVLTHEEIVDLAWTRDLRPLLRQRFPGLSEEQITEAHAYAYDLTGDFCTK
jgi:hypothetical protein